MKLVAGRMFRMGSSEVIVGNSIAKGFQGVGLQRHSELGHAHLDGRGHF